ncbi:MAG: type II toxin-antitoxin system YhaV family toxin [Lautropia sp.]|nr:type II toxin-antitoxin system YhaV family toxin [Lautropia sp.]
MQQHGWTLLFHDCIIEQLQKLHHAASRAEQNDPAKAPGNANVKLFHALSHLMLTVIPADPAKDEYRQGNTLGPHHRHWRRAKIGRRFRLFFRYDTRSHIIIYAWVNDQQTLRAAGSKSDPYTVFEKMLSRGHPPDDWKTLKEHSQQDWQDDQTST